MSAVHVAIIFVGILSFSVGITAVKSGNFNGRFFGADRGENPVFFWAVVSVLFLVGTFSLWQIMLR